LRPHQQVDQVATGPERSEPEQPDTALTGSERTETEHADIEQSDSDLTDSDLTDSDDHPDATRQTLLSEAIGGPRGLVDSGLPAIVFVIANAIGGLTPAIAAAIAVGVVLVAIRLFRKETLQQAIAGFFGVALAALVAARTGHATGFFLPGILYQAVLAVLSVVSLLVGRPYVGYLMAALDPKYAQWRESRPMRRAMALATVLWGLIFAVRAAVQGVLYVHDRVGWLATAKIAMGWPLFAVGLGATYWLTRRASPSPDGSAERAADRPLPQPSDEEVS